MSKPVVPRAIERYVFVRLVGNRDARYRSYGAVDDLSSKIFRDPLELLDPPLDGLFERRMTALRESTNCTEALADFFFDCPHCGDGPHCHPEDQPYIEHLQSEKSRADRAAEELRREIALLERLLDQDQMGDAYAALASEFTNDKHWFDFIEAARNAQKNFSEYRGVQKRARRILAEISVAARQLSTLLLELQRTGVQLPVELQSPTNIYLSFSARESHEARHLKFLRFLEHRQPISATTCSPPIDLRRNLLEVSELASQLPVEFGSPAIEAAISSRQNSSKSAYFRAFGALLAQSNIKLSTPVMRAMAITANVILDDPEMSISEDTVRKALKRSQTRQGTKKGPQG